MAGARSRERPANAIRAASLMADRLLSEYHLRLGWRRAGLEKPCSNQCAIPDECQNASSSCPPVGPPKFRAHCCNLSLQVRRQRGVASCIQPIARLRPRIPRLPEETCDSVSWANLSTKCIYPSGTKPVSKLQRPLTTRYSANARATNEHSSLIIIPAGQWRWTVHRRVDGAWAMSGMPYLCRDAVPDGYPGACG